MRPTKSPPPTESSDNHVWGEMPARKRTDGPVPAGSATPDGQSARVSVTAASNLTTAATTMVRGMPMTNPTVALSTRLWGEEDRVTPSKDRGAWRSSPGFLCKVDQGERETR